VAATARQSLTFYNKGGRRRTGYRPMDRSSIFGRGLLQTGANKVDEALGNFLGRERALAGLHHVLANVVLKNLSHEAVNATADIRK
jgi:hypothetical protein